MTTPILTPEYLASFFEMQRDIEKAAYNKATQIMEFYRVKYKEYLFKNMTYYDYHKLTPKFIIYMNTSYDIKVYTKKLPIEWLYDETDAWKEKIEDRLRKRRDWDLIHKLEK